MIFLAYNYSKYKLNTDENIKFKNFVLNKINENFPGEDYLLPYSQYNQIELSQKLKCEISQIHGNFFEDLPLMMSKCNKLVFFPTESLYIGSCVCIEIACAKRNNFPVYGYDKLKDVFTTNFKLENTEFSMDPKLSYIFNKKTIFI
jgi:hypothetical protein